MAARNRTSRVHRIIIAGFGGQGVLTLGKLLCAAAISEGREVTYLPSYGSEVRGGTANCHVTISDGQIFNPAIEVADSTIIMNRPSFEKFGKIVGPGGIVALNTSLVDAGDYARSQKVTLIPIRATELALEMGNIVVANVLLLGAFNRAVRACRMESIEQALRDLMAGRKSSGLELNLKALSEGARLADELLRTGNR
jgi:2-oxoglutarate ferredoxin oxidoreductase subunit gamma